MDTANLNPVITNPTPPVNPTPIVSTPTSPPVKSNSSILKIIILIIIVLILGIILGNYFNLNQMLSSLIKPQPKACTMEAKVCPNGTSVSRSGPNCEFSPCPTAIATPDPTANWKTYTDSTYGFSFKYPQDHKIEQRENGFFVISLTTDQNPQGGISIDSRNQNPNYKTFTEAEQYYHTSYTINQEDTVNNWKTFIAVGKEGMVQNMIFKIAIAPYKNGVINIETINNQAYSKLFDQILSSFKFLDETGDTSSWKTYTDNTLGLSFKYPINWTAIKSPGSVLYIIINPNLEEPEAPNSEVGTPAITLTVDSARDQNGNYIHLDTIQQAKESYIKGLNNDVIEKNNITIGGKPAITLEGTSTAVGQGNNMFIQYIFIQLENKVLVIQIGKKDLLNTINSILSTFKFNE